MPVKYKIFESLFVSVIVSVRMWLLLQQVLSNVHAIKGFVNNNRWFSFALYLFSTS